MEQPWTVTTSQQNQNPHLVGREDLVTFDYSENKCGNEPLPYCYDSSSHNYEVNSDYSDQSCRNIDSEIDNESSIIEHFLKPNFLNNGQISQNNSKDGSENCANRNVNLNSSNPEHISSSNTSNDIHITNTGQLPIFHSNETNITNSNSNIDGDLYTTNHFHEELISSNSMNSAINSFGANKYHRTCVNNNNLDKNYEFTNEALNAYNSASDVTSTSDNLDSYTTSNNRQTLATENNYNFPRDNDNFVINSTSYFSTQCKYDRSETVNLVGSSDIKVINRENTGGREAERSSRNSDCENNYANVNFTTTFCNKTYETSRTAHEILIKNHNLATANATSCDITSNNDKLHGEDINLVSELQDNNKFYASSSSMFYSNDTTYQYQSEDTNNSNSFSSAFSSHLNADINGIPSNINQNGVCENHTSPNSTGLPSSFNTTCKGNKINDGAASSYGNFYSNVTENNGSRENSNKSGTDGFEIEKERNNGANLNKLNGNAEVKGNELSQCYTNNDYTMDSSTYNQTKTAKAKPLRKNSNFHYDSSNVNPNSRGTYVQGNLRQFTFPNYFLENKWSPPRSSSLAQNSQNTSGRYQQNFTPRYPHQLYYSYPDYQYQNGLHSSSKSVSSSSKASIRSSGQPASAAAVAATVNNINALLSSSGPPAEQKPVECNLCHRKFKNIPALNGHMRLHGGYFKKESEGKKNDKKDSSTGGSTAPLQTASISVRALIEEKIIQKRSSNPAHTQTNLSYSNSSLQTSTTTSAFSNSTSSLSENSRDSLKLSSFVVPATPHSSEDKSTQRRHSDSENFISPRTPPISTSPSSEPDIQHKKNTKPGVKRASSDPGSQSVHNSDVNLSFNDTLTSYTGVLGVYHGDDGYFSPSLQDEMFNHVQAIQDSLLLQGVDAAQLAESIQAATLQEIASLEEYSNSDPNNHYQQDLQSVLNSPLPVSIADFAYQAQNQSFTQETTFTQSPLPSPSFTYPTPPASQEGQSPSFGNLQSVISHPSSSPLSASFCMSSSAAVEAALNEVLPMEQHNIYPSPPPQSPLSGTPVPSPLSLPPSSVSSPLPHQMLQSHMMSNSDDPLLSSSPKDFAPRKKFDFHTFKIVNNDSLDYLNCNQQGVTGIVLDRNGELKLIQNGFQHGKPNGLLNGITTVYVKQEPQSMDMDVKPIVSTIAMGNKTYQNSSRFVPQIKEEVEDEAFTNFVSMSDHTSKYPSISNGFTSTSSSRKRRLDCGSYSSHPSYQSRLRSVRPRTSATSHIHYSPSPMLSPSRSGSGLYWQAVTSWPSSTTFKDENVSAAEMRYLESRDMAPECDSSPHVNIGPQYQALIPECCPYGAKTEREPSYELLLWDPGISKVTTEAAVDMYLEFACCAAVPGCGRNKEYALHLLHLCNGNIHVAMLRLMQPTPLLPQGHPLLSMQYTDSDRWNSTEIETFQQALLKYDKDLYCVAQEIGSKNLKQCIQFYYLWKKVCPDEYKRIRLSRRRNRDFDFDFEFKSDIPMTDVDLVSTSSESRLFVCEYPDCSASFNSRAALNGHIKIHGGPSNNSLERRSTPTPTPTPPTLSVSSADLLEEFPCKICGKVFNKVKSRSAHMKSHRPLDADPKKAKQLPSSPVFIFDSVETGVGRAMGITTTCVQSQLRPN